MKPLIEKALSSLEKPIAMRIFVLISFLESALLPIPIESLSIPLLTARKNPWPIAFWGSISSVLGGIAGYFIGFALFETLGQWIIQTYGMQEQYENLKITAASNLGKGAWLIIIGAITPIPFKLVSIACGAVHFHFLIFVLMAVIGRSARYFFFSLAFHIFGDRLRQFVHERPRLMTVVIVLVMIGGFALVFLS